jgi:hypothetical protein
LKPLAPKPKRWDIREKNKRRISDRITGLTGWERNEERLLS